MRNTENTIETPDDGTTWICLSATGFLHVGTPTVSENIGHILNGTHNRQVNIREDGEYIIEVRAYNGLDISYHNELIVSKSAIPSKVFVAATLFTFVVSAKKGDVITFSKNPIDKVIRPFNSLTPGEWGVVSSRASIPLKG